MITQWDNKKIAEIVAFLNKNNLPFKDYSFLDIETGLHLLGTGGYSNVYEAYKRGDAEKRYAIKVIGFGDKTMEIFDVWYGYFLQRSMRYCKNVVKVYEFAEARIWMDEDGKITKVRKINSFEDNEEEGDYLDLQFIVMEKLVPVISYNNSNAPKLFPYKLELHDEAEIMKMAYEIGFALKTAHENNMLHRDIKLENIFYDTENNRYKLGDFGISKITTFGIASTIVYTNGYGAPEVIHNNSEKYDSTADIYSLGMAIYLLLNDLKFPESSGYSVNNKSQYSENYQLPKPAASDTCLWKIAQKMCDYNPDNRYRNGKEFIYDFEAYAISPGMRYKNEHVKTPAILGCFLAILGIIGLITGNSWFTLSSLVNGMSLLEQVSLVRCDILKVKKVLLHGNMYWWFILFAHIWLTVIMGIIFNSGLDLPDTRLFSVNWFKYGLSVMIFSIFWIVRDAVLTYFYNKSKV